MGSEHWISCGKDGPGHDIALYVVESQNATHRVLLGNDAWLLVHEDGIHIAFAVFVFCMGPVTGPTDRSDIKPDPVKHTMLFHGSGPSGSLRECRHIWWGEREDPEMRGYTYYLNFATVEAAFRELRRWFDGD